MQIYQRLKSLFEFAWDEQFLKKIKWFMEWYGWFFTGLILALILITPPPVPVGLYFCLSIAFAATSVLTFMPVSWLRRVLPLSIPAYILFIHLFLTYTNGDRGGFQLLYFLPVVFSSLLFNFTGMVISMLLTAISRIILSGLVLAYSNLSQIMNHLVSNDLPFFTVGTLLGVTASFVSKMIMDDRNSVFNLYVQVERSKRDWETTFNAIKDMIAIYDSSYRLVMANKAAERLTVKYGDILGKMCNEIYCCADSPVAGDCPHVQKMKEGHAYSFEVEKLFPGETFEVSACPIIGENGKMLGSVHCMKDVTAQRIAEEALKKELEITKALYNTELAIVSTIDKEEVLRLCVKNIRPLLEAECVSLALFNAEKKSFRIAVTSFHDSLQEDKERIPFDSTILNTVISSRLSRYCSELTEDSLLSHDAWLKDKGLKSLLMIPLIAKGVPLGVLILGASRLDNFSQDVITLAERYAVEVAIALENSNLYESLRNLFLNTVTSLSSAIDAKSPWTQDHSKETANYGIAIARELDHFDEETIEELRLAFILHDIGKIGIDKEILDKKSNLTKEEFEIMKRHPLKGASILEPIKEFKSIIPIIRHHHEWWDGRGYPDGLSGNTIPLGARILAVADAFESMITARPYKPRFTIEEAKMELLRYAGTQFDPQVVDALLACLKKQRVK